MRGVNSMGRKRRSVIAPLVGAVLVSLSPVSISQASDSSQATALKTIQARVPGKVVVERNAQGRISHLRASEAPLPVDSALDPESRARKVLNQYHDAFVDPSLSLDLSTARLVARDAFGQSHIRFQQAIGGIPVRGGEVIVHLDASGVTSISSKLLGDANNLDLVPKVDSVRAQIAAGKNLKKSLGLSRVRISVPKLEILSQELNPGKTPRLAWMIQANSKSAGETLWVDAQTGTVLLAVSNTWHAVAVTDYQGYCYDQDTTGAPFYSDSASAAGSINPEVKLAYDNLTYATTYFSTTLGYTADAYGGVSVAVCDGSDPFEPTIGAALNTLNVGEIILQPGNAAADDIIGHEFTHAAIAATSKLLAARESGALGEGFADIFGEVVDLVQNTTNDAGQTRWDFGEAVSGGPFRNLLSPGNFGLPGKVSDSNFYCGADDSIFSHTNGAVLAQAFALLADGGTYNGFTINGIGITKAAQVFFDTMSNRLVQASVFKDAYAALKASGAAVLGSGSAEYAALVKALDAVELNKDTCKTKIDYCPTGQSAVTLFYDGFENPASGNWTNEVASGVNHWTNFGSGGVGSPAIYFAAENTGLRGGAIGILPANGTYALWASLGKSTNAQGESSVSMANDILIPSGTNVRMQFEGRYQFDTGSETFSNGQMITTGPEGGRIEYSTDGGASWQDGGPLISGGRAYAGTIDDSTNPLVGLPAFLDLIPPPDALNYNYESTQLDMSGAGLAGKSLRIRFRFGSNPFTTLMGWQVDDVNIYSCVPAALVVSPTSGLTTSEAGGTATFTVHLANAPTTSVTLKIESKDLTEGTVSPAELVFDSTNYASDQQVTITGLDDSDSDGNVAYTVTVSVDPSSDSAFTAAPSVDVSVTNSDNEGSKKKGGGAVDSSWVPLLIIIWMLRIASSRVRRISIRR